MARREFTVLLLFVIVVVSSINFLVIRYALVAIANSSPHDPRDRGPSLVQNQEPLKSVINSVTVAPPSEPTAKPLVLFPIPPSPTVALTTAPTPVPFKASNRPLSTFPKTYRHYTAGEIPDTLHNIAQAAVLILCYNRPDYLTSTIMSLYLATFVTQLTVYVSQDGTDSSVSEVIRTFAKSKRIVHLQHPQMPSYQLPYKASKGTQRLARHYKWALDHVLQEQNHTHAIILEVDMVVSTDIFSYFEQTAPLLESEKTTWCISSWNDLGFNTMDLSQDKMFRTSFFPGLGWMLKRSLWVDELSAIFPIDHWDHWMRVPTISKGRDCIVPYLSRNKNIGVYGANVDENEFDQYLNKMDFYQEKKLVSLGDLSYLQRQQYEATIRLDIQKSKVVTSVNYDTIRNDPTFLQPEKSYLILYVKESFVALSEVLSIYPTPKALFQGVIVLHINAATLYLADQRRSDLIPSEHKIHPSPMLKPISSSSPGLNCHDVCKTEKRSCSEADFEFINDCEVLARHFDCKRGCSREWGPDIPNYAVNPEDPKNYQKCLITEDTPQCDASHPSTRRLCPCV